MVHEKAPHIKSLMITGPRGVGKKMLVHAVCTESGSNLFDLTPSTITAASRYAGKPGLAMLLHMVFKVCMHTCARVTRVVVQCGQFGYNFRKSCKVSQLELSLFH